MVLSDCIAPAFYDIHESIKIEEYTHYWLDGGRGSCKTSFIAIEIILGMLDEAKKGNVCNAIALRQVKDTLSESVFENFKWAISLLGVDSYFRATSSPLRITCLINGAKILFRGADDVSKIKSIKLEQGYFKWIWFEELTEFKSMAHIRNLLQSLMRGDGKKFVFYAYNAPKSLTEWVNIEQKKIKSNRISHHSDYRTVPKHWLGADFIAEAEELKDSNYSLYEHEYLGLAKGTGGEIFTNLDYKEISDDEIKEFDNILYGLDFGFAVDPLHILGGHYDSTRRKLYLFKEFRGLRVSNAKIVEEVQNNWLSYIPIFADSEEPRTISELRSEILIHPVQKGPDSIRQGIKFLQDLNKIIIDPVRCPHTYEEFSKYEFERDREGNFISEYPDKNNHAIDACRYLIRKYSLVRGIRKLKGAV